MIYGRRKGDSLSIRMIAPIMVMLIGYLVWEAHAPVIRDFKINHTIQTENTLQIYGTFQKLKNCKFDSLFITTPIDTELSRKLIFEFTDVANKPFENQATRQKGLQHYGPWTIQIDPKVTTINMRTLHRCNFGLYTSTYLIRDFPVNEGSGF